jgi:hypothetical protein
MSSNGRIRKEFSPSGGSISSLKIASLLIVCMLSASTVAVLFEPNEASAIKKKFRDVKKPHHDKPASKHIWSGNGYYYDPLKPASHYYCTHHHPDGTSYYWFKDSLWRCEHHDKD